MSDEAPFDKAWRRLIDGAVAAALKASEREEGAAALDRLTGLLGTSTEALKADPSIAHELVQGAFAQAAHVAQDAASGDPERRAAARAAVERLGERLGVQQGARPPWLDALEAKVKELPERAAAAIQQLAAEGAGLREPGSTSPTSDHAASSSDAPPATAPPADA